MGSCFSAQIKAESNPVHNGGPPTPRTEDQILQSCNLKSFSFSELRTATRNFRPKSVVGQGGFGCVFKAWIDEITLTPTKPLTGMVIAVKKPNKKGLQGHKEWLTEIDYLGQLYHPNLVKPIEWAAYHFDSIEQWSADNFYSRFILWSAYHFL